MNDSEYKGKILVNLGLIGKKIDYVDNMEALTEINRKIRELDKTISKCFLKD